MKFNLIKTTIVVSLSCIILSGFTGSVYADNPNTDSYPLSAVTFKELPKPTDGMTDEEKQAYFENLYPNKVLGVPHLGSFSIDIPTASDKADEEAEKNYPLDKVTFTELPKPTDGMTDEEKKAYFEGIFGDTNNNTEASYRENGIIVTYPPLRDGSPPSASDFHNLSSSDYSGSGTFTANYLYTLKCFAPNSSNNLVICGSASAIPSAHRMFISVYDVTDRRSGTEFSVDASYIASDYSNSYFNYAFAIGPLNPNHLYSVKFTPNSALSQYSVNFTVSHS